MSAMIDMARRTVGVVHATAGRAEGYVLLSISSATYLLDDDGRVAHSWPSKRHVFCAYLLGNGDLLRDGNEMALAPQFRAGGAAGYVERVTWDGAVVWNWSALPRFRYLSHHDLEPLPDGGALVLVWEKKSKAAALAAGRHPELAPDGEVWNNLVVEIAGGDGTSTATEVWRWDQWAHLCQDWDDTKENYVADVAEHPHRLDVNYCPPGGKARCRNGGLKAGDHTASGHAVFDYAPGQTGERDWLHANSVAFAATSKLVVVSYNVPCEIILFAHRGDGGILYRFGNPLVARAGDRFAQELFVQHSATVVNDGGADGLRVLVFNNGRAPDRMWSTVDEFSVDVERRSHARVWSHGPPAGRAGSFYCHHSSGVRRLANGNTLVTRGPQGVVVEVDADGTEVWRYVNPVESRGPDGRPAIVRQGDHRGAGRFGLFVADKYDAARVPRLGALAPRAGARLEDGAL